MHSAILLDVQVQHTERVFPETRLPKRHDSRLSIIDNSVGKFTRCLRTLMIE